MVTVFLSFDFGVNASVKYLTSGIDAVMGAAILLRYQKFIPIHI